MPSFPAFNVTCESRYGTMIYNDNDIYIGRSLSEYGEYSYGEAELFEQLIEEKDVVIEVGASIGVHTLALAREVGPRGRVLAFEPQRVVYQTLCGNLALNNLTNVHCWNVALGAKMGEIVVPTFDYTREDNYGGISLGQYTEGEHVPVVPLDCYNVPDCSLIKIDVEGMERAVLEGAAVTIARSRPFLYVECNRDDSADLLRYIDSLNYDMYWHMPFLFNPDNFKGNTENVFGELVSKNVLCVYKGADIDMEGFQPVVVPNAT